MTAGNEKDAQNSYSRNGIIVSKYGVRTESLFVRMDQISSLEIIDRSAVGKSLDVAGGFLPAAALVTGGLAIIPALVVMTASRVFVESTFHPWLRIHLVGGGYQDIQAELFGISLEDLKAIKDEIEKRL